jgi:hypothetical protein
MFHQYPKLASSRHFSFSPEGMRLEAESGQADLKWSAFYRIVETRKVFIFMQTHRGGTYVPKRCLSNPEEVAILRRLIRDNFMGKTRLEPG